jgi:hypothetical protein
MFSWAITTKGSILAWSPSGQAARLASDLHAASPFVLGERVPLQTDDHGIKRRILSPFPVHLIQPRGDAVPLVLPNVSRDGIGVESTAGGLQAFGQAFHRTKERIQERDCGFHTHEHKQGDLIVNWDGTSTEARIACDRERVDGPGRTTKGTI